MFHKNIADNQRATYNAQRKDVDFLRGRLLIEIDFKSKFLTGMNPRQVNREFYNRVSHTCLGM